MIDPWGSRLGFMQGRLSPQVNGTIQAFPWDHWEHEFAVASRLGMKLMEWTLDQDRLLENPLLTVSGRRRIRELELSHGVRVASVTGDNFMQAPFCKADERDRAARLAEFRAVIDSCGEMGIPLMVFPLVDNGAIESAAQLQALRRGFEEAVPWLRQARVRIAFETELPPGEVAELFEMFSSDCFGWNYDIGNSAAMGFDPAQELTVNGRRILNVHVKDRKLGGTTVPLGTGDADLPKVLSLLVARGYRGNFILQTARAEDGDHEGAIRRYRNLAAMWLDGTP